MWRDVRRGGRRCAGIVNVMLMVLMGSRCHTSGMRIQSHAGVTLLPVYMPRVRTLGPDHLRSDLREPNEHNLLLSLAISLRASAWDRPRRRRVLFVSAAWFIPSFIPHFLTLSFFNYLNLEKFYRWLVTHFCRTAISLNRVVRLLGLFFSLNLKCRTWQHSSFPSLHTFNVLFLIIPV